MPPACSPPPPTATWPASSASPPSCASGSRSAPTTRRAARAAPSIQGSRLGDGRVILELTLACPAPPARLLDPRRLVRSLRRALPDPRADRGAGRRARGGLPPRRARGDARARTGPIRHITARSSVSASSTSSRATTTCSSSPPCSCAAVGSHPAQDHHRLHARPQRHPRPRRARARDDPRPPRRAGDRHVHRVGGDRERRPARTRPPGAGS